MGLTVSEPRLRGREMRRPRGHTQRGYPVANKSQSFKIVVWEINVGNPSKKIGDRKNFINLRMLEWRSLGESNPRFSLERPKTAHHYTSFYVLSCPVIH